MGYRKIVVDGKAYNYKVGKDYTKVAGMPVFRNQEYGVDQQPYSDRVVIRPSDIVRMIRSRLA